MWSGKYFITLLKSWVERRQRIGFQQVFEIRVNDEKWCSGERKVCAFGRLVQRALGPRACGFSWAWARGWLGRWGWQWGCGTPLSDFQNNQFLNKCRSQAEVDVGGKSLQGLFTSYLDFILGFFAAWTVWIYWRIFHILGSEIDNGRGEKSQN